MNAFLRSAISILFCGAVLCPSPLAAADLLKPANGEVDTVRVGFSSMPGFLNVDENGVRSGYGYDFLCLVRRYANIHFEFVGQNSSSDELQSRLLSGDIDMITSGRKIEGTMDLFDLSSPIGTHSLMLNIRAGDDRFIPGIFSTYNGMSIGLIARSGSEPRVDQFARESGFSYRKMFFESADEMVIALQNGEIDAIATTSLRKTENEKTISTFATDYFYAMVRKGDERLLNLINSAIAQINENERNWQSILYERNYHSSVDSKLYFTPAEQEYIRQHSGGGEKIRIAFDNSWAPFSHFENGHYEGIIPNLWDKLMEMTGMEYEPYEYHNSIIPERDLLEGDADIFLGYYSDQFYAESRGFVPSSPFIEAAACFVQKKSETKNTLIGISSVNPMLNKLLILENGQRTIEYPSSEEVLKALNSGEIDRAFLYTFEGDYLINKDMSGNLISHMVPYINVAFCAVSPDTMDHTLISIVSKCINALTEADLNTIISSSLTVDPSNIGLFDYMMIHKTPFILTGMLLFGFFFFMLYYLIRHQTEKKYSASLEEKQEQLKEINEKMEENLDIISNTGFGIWRIWEDDHGTMCMGLDDVLKRTFGIEQELSPAETYVYYHSRLKEEDVESIHANDYTSMWEGRIMTRTLEWMHPTKGRIYLSAGGTSYEQADGQIIISGFCADISNQKFQENRANRVITSLARSYKMINYMSLDKGTFINYMTNASYTYSERMILSGGNIDEALSYHLDKKVSPEFKAEMTEFVDLSTINERARNRDILINQYRDHKEAWHEWSYIVADRNEDGSVKHMICAIRMIDDEKQAELRKQQIIEDNIAANKAKTKFLQNMSHEIRTPLNAIVGFSQLLSIPGMELSEQEREEYFGYIANNTEMLTMLIDDILDISDDEHGNYRVILSDWDCNEICRKALSSVEYRVPSGVTTRFTTDIPDGYMVKTDGKRVQQVLTNYLTNACKHTIEGEIRVDASMSVRPGKLSFSVTDTGTGVPEDKMDTIFDRFTKLDQFTQGSGLGLNICSMIADKLGGEVFLDKSYRRGARFVFVIDDTNAE